MKKIKGISPLVAAVLLIAITMTIAGMLAYWATSFTKSGLPTNVTEVQCIGANIRVYDCKYNATLSRADIILQNIGSVDLSNITVNIQYLNASIQSFSLNGTLNKNTIASYQLNGISSDYSRFIILTPCPGVEATTTCGR
ncbi:MAG: archaellin/type IV pilin N-terminal domain-containing protein [Candidatus Pacearchaeota archaeon]